MISARRGRRSPPGFPSDAYVHAVREDTVRKGLLFAGTEKGVYVSFDDGANWQKLQLNLPITPIHDLVVHANDLAVATHGRAFWILDDITPLREAGNGNAEAVLYRPRESHRFHYPDGVDKRRPVGENPPNGSTFYYYLKNAPKDEANSGDSRFQREARKEVLQQREERRWAAAGVARPRAPAEYHSRQGRAEPLRMELALRGSCAIAGRLLRGTASARAGGCAGQLHCPVNGGRQALRSAVRTEGGPATIGRAGAAGSSSR